MDHQFLLCRHTLTPLSHTTKKTAAPSLHTTMRVTVRLSFCEALHPPPGAGPVTVGVDLDPTDTITTTKHKVAAALGPRVPPASLLLHFGPVDAVIGSAYAGDPGADEDGVTLGQYSALSWVARFPSWPLGVRPLPPPPPPPGVAAHQAAALAEGKDPDAAVAAARAQVRGERERERGERGEEARVFFGQKQHPLQTRSLS